MDVGKNAKLFSLLLIFNMMIAFYCQGQVVHNDTLESGGFKNKEIHGGHIHNYFLHFNKGEYFKGSVAHQGIDIYISTFKPDGRRIKYFDSQINLDGIQEFFITADTTGYYQFSIQPSDTVSLMGNYSVTVIQRLTAGQYGLFLAEEKAKQEKITKWLKINAIPLKYVESENNFNDLKQMKNILKDFRIVGLGEATHGTKEFFQFKHRMAEFLIKEMGFTVFGIEAGYSACKMINEYILNKTSDKETALRSMGYWTWRTEEVSAMLEWMRNYNLTVKDDQKKIKFYGFDFSNYRRALDELVDYLAWVDSDQVVVMDSVFQQILTAEYSDDREQLTKLLLPLNDLLKNFNMNELKFKHITSNENYEEAKFNLTTLIRFVDIYRRPDYYPLNMDTTMGYVRDRYMAENIEYFLNRNDKNSRMILWAHNDHIAKGNYSLGYHLQKKYGKEYYAMAFSFNEGSFQAMELSDQGIKPLREFIIGKAPNATLDWYLSRPGIANYIVNFRNVTSDNKALTEWLNTPLPMHTVGAVYSSDWGNPLKDYKIIENFDALIFINKTSRATPYQMTK